MEEPLKTPNVKLLKRAGMAAASFAAILIAAGIAVRMHDHAYAAQQTKAQALPTVSLVQFKPDAGGESIVLPGNIQPYNRAAIYARVNGYLRNWQADIGTPVKAGQTLAVIDAPDLDQQYAQAKAALTTDVVNARLAVLTAQRWQSLLAENAVARQDADTKNAAADAANAMVAAARANLSQLAVMESYKTLTAPFDGIVTARNTDIGALIGAGNSGTELFEVSDLHAVRIYVQVPQTMSGQVAPGMTASFTLPQYPGRQFKATVNSISHAMDPTSHNMQVELLADNADGKLFADTYCQVQFHLPSQPDTLLLPATALFPSNSGAQVALLAKDNRVVLRPIHVGRDLGNNVEVLAGLSPKDKVIDSPPETLEAGSAVQVSNIHE